MGQRDTFADKTWEAEKYVEQGLSLVGAKAEIFRVSPRIKFYPLPRPPIPVTPVISSPPFFFQFSRPKL